LSVNELRVLYLYYRRRRRENVVWYCERDKMRIIDIPRTVGILSQVYVCPGLRSMCVRNFPIVRPFRANDFFRIDLGCNTDAVRLNGITLLERSKLVRDELFLLNGQTVRNPVQARATGVNITRARSAITIRKNSLL
jgi:hypothetical protein